MVKLGVTPAAALSPSPMAEPCVWQAGNVIVRQRPGTAKGITLIAWKMRQVFQMW
jgi:hypothetical protein